MKKIIVHTQHGFTLVETLIAVAILMIAIAGPLTIAHKGLLSAVYANDQITASYLAQDAIEYLKNIKDNNMIQGVEWLRGLQVCNRTNVCTVDTFLASPSDPTVYSAGTPPFGISTPITVSLVDGIPSCDITACILEKDAYGYHHPPSGGTPTHYKRYFYVDYFLDSTKQAKIVVIVKWKTGTIENIMTYENDIFNTSRSAL